MAATAFAFALITVEEVRVARLPSLPRPPLSHVSYRARRVPLAVVTAAALDAGGRENDVDGLITPNFGGQSVTRACLLSVLLVRDKI